MPSMANWRSTRARAIDADSRNMYLRYGRPCPHYLHVNHAPRDRTPADQPPRPPRHEPSSLPVALLWVVIIAAKVAGRAVWHSVVRSRATRTNPTPGTIASLFVARQAVGLLVLVAVVVIAPELVRRAALQAPDADAPDGVTLTLVGTARSWASLLHQHRVRVGVDVAPEHAARLRKGWAAVVTPLNARHTRLGGRVVRVADHVDIATQLVAVEVEVDDTASAITRGAAVEVEVEVPGGETPEPPEAR